jgi:U3 small nucleolar RNA-associated protein 21
MLHPSTYLNKILVSSTQGTMQIWNIRTNKMVYQFGYLGSAVTCLAQSPVVDVIAIGLLNGTVVLHNIKVDEKIDSVRQDDRVTAITFRTGNKKKKKQFLQKKELTFIKMRNKSWRLVICMVMLHYGIFLLVD